MKIIFYVFYSVLLVFLLTACGGKELLKPANPMGLSGKYNPEAESAFALAHVLWRNSDVCSDPQQAVELLNKAIRLEPNYADAYLRRGLAKSDMRDWEGAFEDLTYSIRLKPTAEAYAFRGLISMRGGNAIGARKDYERSLEINAKQHKAWNYRAALNLLEGHRDEACRDFRKGCDNGDCVGYESAVTYGECPK